jgi:hypothetical protein
MRLHTLLVNRSGAIGVVAVDNAANALRLLTVG